MTRNYSICLGTIGGGVWHSPDGGENWNKIGSPFPRPGEHQVRALGVYPNDPRRVLAGSDVGIYRSNDSGATWEKLESPMDGMQIWSVAVDPIDQDIIFAGTKPPGVFRSRDGGRQWEKLSVDIVEECFAGSPKVTAIIIDPRDHRIVWAGVEIDGVFKSMDGGDTWTHLPDLGDDVLNQDIHGMAISVGQPTKILATTPNGIFTSTDEGESWELHEFPLFTEGDRLSYCRGVTLKADDPNVIYVGNGANQSVGKTGRVQRSKDGGKTWESLPMLGEPNSTMYWIATNPAEPNRVVANTIYGEVYTSDDGGDSWEKVQREFGEVRAIAWMPS